MEDNTYVGITLIRGFYVKDTYAQKNYQWEVWNLKKLPLYLFNIEPIPINIKSFIRNAFVFINRSPARLSYC